MSKQSDKYFILSEVWKRWAVYSEKEFDEWLHKEMHDCRPDHEKEMIIIMRAAAILVITFIACGIIYLIQPFL